VPVSTIMLFDTTSMGTFCIWSSHPHLLIVDTYFSWYDSERISESIYFCIIDLQRRNTIVGYKFLENNIHLIVL